MKKNHFRAAMAGCVRRCLAVCTVVCLALSANCLPTLPANAADYVQNKTRVSVHDPSVFRDPQSGKYYVFGSHIDAARSDNLQSWTRFTNGYATVNNQLFGSLSQNLAGAFAWAGENLEDCADGFAVWAPDVIYNPAYVNADGTKGAYLIYFCTSSTYMRSVIAFAASKKAEGPYTFVDTLIYSGFTANDSYATSNTKNVNRKYTSTNVDELIAAGQVTYNSAWFSNNNFNNRTYPNAIDPTIYYDTDGKMYLCYGSWSGGIFSLEMNPATGRCIHPKTGTTADGRLVDSYFGTKLSGGFGKSGEGPFIEYNPETGYYYLWVTYGGLLSEGGYNMRVFRSKNALGPFVDAAGREAVLTSSSNLDSVGVKVMGNYRFSSQKTAYMACGHNSVLRDDDGKWYLFYHARFDDGSEYHEVRVHAMTFNAAGWPVVAPYEYSGEDWAAGGYEPANLAGSYDFINHGNDTGKNIYQSATVTLREDGSVSGAATGTWKQADDSADATFTLGGVTYHGAFLAQYDESKTAKRVMTFTAVGANNQTIWGVQTTAWQGKARSTLRDYTNAASVLVEQPDSVTLHETVPTICETSLLSSVLYVLTNVNSGKALSLTDGKTADGTPVQQWTKTGAAQQEWRILALPNGYCQIVSLADESKCLAVEVDTAENGANVVLQRNTEDIAQQWKLVADGTAYGIVSRLGEGFGLDVYDWSTEDGGDVNLWEYWGGACQQWVLTPTHAKVVSGTYAIRNQNSGLWVGAFADGLRQGAEPFAWTLTENGGTYTFAAETGAVLTQTGETANGTALQLGTTDAKAFTIWCNQNGSYAILAADAPTIGWDVTEGSQAAGATVTQWTFRGDAGQQFVLEPIPKPTSSGLRGDVDCSGAVDIGDVILLARFLAEDLNVKVTELGVQNADCNDNGLPDAADATLIMKYLAGLISSL